MTEENKINLALDLPPDLYDWLCEDAAAHQRTFEAHSFSAERLSF
jgi:hypothetical protein